MFQMADRQRMSKTRAKVTEIFMVSIDDRGTELCSLSKSTIDQSNISKSFAQTKNVAQLVDILRCLTKGKK